MCDDGGTVLNVTLFWIYIILLKKTVQISMLHMLFYSVDP